MVSAGLGDFLVLLLVLADQGVTGRVVYGRCPDCGEELASPDALTLIGVLLEHELRDHVDVP